MGLGVESPCCRGSPESHAPLGFGRFGRFLDPAAVPGAHGVPIKEEIHRELVPFLVNPDQRDLAIEDVIHVGTWLALTLRTLAEGQWRVKSSRMARSLNMA